MPLRLSHKFFSPQPLVVAQVLTRLYGVRRLDAAFPFLHRSGHPPRFCGTERGHSCEAPSPPWRASPESDRDQPPCHPVMPPAFCWSTIAKLWRIKDEHATVGGCVVTVKWDRTLLI